MAKPLQNSISPQDFQLLKKEVETSGEILSEERLDRKAQMDELKLELTALRRTLSELLPEFEERFHEIREALPQEFDPETEESVSKAG